MSGKKGVTCHRWTDAEKARLAEIAPGRTSREIYRIMTDEFGDHFGGHRITAALNRYGDWNIRDVSKGSCCRGTVVATLSGKQGRAEVWNNGECYAIPKGGEPELVDSPAEACAIAGIAERLPLTC